MNLSPHLQAVARELAAFGIKPTFEPTKSNHVRVIFSAGNGKTYTTVTSLTPSDHRTTLNVRAVIRRQLREAGAVELAKQPAPPLLQKALSAPAPHADPLAKRVERLEADVATLLDMLADMETRAAKLAEPVKREPAPAKVPRKYPQHRVRGPSAEMLHLLRCMESKPLHASEITRRDGRTRHKVEVSLTTLKKKGLVENVTRGMWRKIVPGEPPPPPPPPKPQTERGRRHGDGMHETLLAVDYTWTDFKTIQKRTGRKRSPLGGTLDYLKKRGLVEHGTRGLWRKVVKPNGAANGAH